jgi:hypothetical protein
MLMSNVESELRYDRLSLVEKFFVRLFKGEKPNISSILYLLKICPRNE